MQNGSLVDPRTGISAKLYGLHKDCLDDSGKGPAPSRSTCESQAEYEQQLGSWTRSQERVKGGFHTEVHKALPMFAMEVRKQVLEDEIADATKVLALSNSHD